MNKPALTWRSESRTGREPTRGPAPRGAGWERRWGRCRAPLSCTPPFRTRPNDRSKQLWWKHHPHAVVDKHHNMLVLDDAWTIFCIAFSFYNARTRWFFFSQNSLFSGWYWEYSAPSISGFSTVTLIVPCNVLSTSFFKLTKRLFHKHIFDNSEMSWKFLRVLNCHCKGR